MKVICFYSQSRDKIDISDLTEEEAAKTVLITDNIYFFADLGVWMDHEDVVKMLQEGNFATVEAIQKAMDEQS